MTDGKGDTVTVGGQTKHVIGYMKDFLFTPEQIRTPLRALSGGERGRLMLARALAKPSNLLVLDEPTNDLDLETLDVLEETLADYSGTVILISHDRDFLDRVVSAVIVPEGDGVWNEYAGGYSDMLIQRGADIASTKPVRAPAAKEVEGRRHASRRQSEEEAVLQREIRARQSAEADREAGRRDRAPCKRSSTIPGSMRATARPSMPPPPRSPRRRPNLRRRKRNGSNSKCCARRSRARPRATAPSRPSAPSASST